MNFLPLPQMTKRYTFAMIMAGLLIILFLSRGQISIHFTNCWRPVKLVQSLPLRYQGRRPGH